MCPVRHTVQYAFGSFFVERRCVLLTSRYLSAEWSGEMIMRTSKATKVPPCTCTTTSKVKGYPVTAQLGHGTPWRLGCSHPLPCEYVQYAKHSWPLLICAAIASFGVQYRRSGARAAAAAGIRCLQLAADMAALAEYMLP